MEQLMQEIASLEKELQTSGDRNEHMRISNLLSGKRSELVQLQEQKEQQEREQLIEEKVTGDEITFNVPGVDFKELPAELITLIDRVVRADRRRIYAEEGEKFDELSRAAGERETNLKFQKHELEKIIDNGRTANESLIHENGNLRDHMARVNDEKADLETKLRNAAAQLEEQATEIERLNSQVNEYQLAKVFGERDAQQIIDVTPEESSDMQNLVNNIAKKYVSITPIAANWHEAIAEDGSKTVVHTKDLPSLETQGSQFRGNDQAGNQEAILPSVNQGPQFPSAPNVETVHAPELATGDVSGESTHEQVAEKTESERIAELERRVEALEKDNKILTVDWPKSAEVA